MGAAFLSCLIEIAQVCSRSGWEGASVVTDQSVAHVADSKNLGSCCAVQIVHHVKSFLQAKDIQRSGQESNRKNLERPTNTS